jgi:hypothetical protein
MSVYSERFRAEPKKIEFIDDRIQVEWSTGTEVSTRINEGLIKRLVSDFEEAEAEKQLEIDKALSGFYIESLLVESGVATVVFSRLNQETISFEFAVRKDECVIKKAHLMLRNNYIHF